MPRMDEILTFWFGHLRDDQPYYQERARIWFAANPQFDQEVTARFAADYELAAERKLMEWQGAPHGGLALILLLDQFPRNMFRGQPRAFTTDPLAREVAGNLLQAGSDRYLLPVERLFIYLPFMHSEHREHQRQAVALFRTLAEERDYFADTLSYAVRHLETIERFGRFPHRNAILGRTSTPEEVEFLKQPGA